MRRILALLLTITLTACGTPSQPEQPRRLPDLTLPGLRAGDQSVELASLDGPALINVWGSYCEPCRDEMPIIVEFARRHPEMKVIGVDYTDPDVEAARALAGKAPFLMVTDLDGDLPVRFLPQFILLDTDGTIVWSGYVAIKSLDQLERLVEEKTR